MTFGTLNRTRPVLAAIVLTVVSSCSSPAVKPPLAGISHSDVTAPAGYVHRRGTELVDETGAPIRLRGPALGGWLTWEGWMWGAGFQSEREIMAKLASRVGTAKAEQFRNDVYRNFVREPDFRLMKSLAFNNVKLAINHRVLEEDGAPFVYKPEGFALLDDIIDSAERSGIHVTLDLHSTPCGQMRAFPVDPGTDADPQAILWDNAECQERTVAWWKAVASHFRDRTIISGYDLMGEPWPNRCSRGPKLGQYCGPADSCGFGSSCDVRGEELESLDKRIIAAIRSVDPFHLIILEGARYSQDFSMFSTRLDDNMVYGPHDYLFDGGDPKKLLQGWDTLAERDQVPLWIGEMGLSSNRTDTRRQANLYDADPRVSGWAYWSWKLTPSYHLLFWTSQNKFLLGIQTTPLWDKVTAWINDGAAPRPTPSETEQAMAEFIHAIRLENNVYDEETVEALMPR